MAIEDLMRVVPPPAGPIEGGSEDDWGPLQEAIGLSLPDDLRDFGIRYGSGRFCHGYLTVFNPFSPRYLDCIAAETKTLRINKASQGNIEFPYDVFPDAPGLLPWGGDENGHTLHWLTEGEPSTWPVIINSHDGTFERFDVSLTTFLARALVNDIRPKYVWTEPFSEDERIFTPAATA